MHSFKAYQLCKHITSLINIANANKRQGLATTQIIIRQMKIKFFASCISTENDVHKTETSGIPYFAEASWDRPEPSTLPCCTNGPTSVVHIFIPIGCSLFVLNHRAEHGGTENIPFFHHLNMNRMYKRHVFSFFPFFHFLDDIVYFSELILALQILML